MVGRRARGDGDRPAGVPGVLVVALGTLLVMLPWRRRRFRAAFGLGAAAAVLCSLAWFVSGLVGS